MDSSIREQVLGMVAGMRGEKRAARSAVVKRLLSAFRRGKSLLTGSRLKRLEAHRDALADTLGAAERNAGQLQREYFSLHNSDPLHHVDLTPGKWVGAPDYLPNLSYLDLKGPALSEAERVSRALRPRIDAAEKLYNAAMDRFWGASHRLHGIGVNLDTGKRVGGIMEQIENERRAVNAARLLSGIGAAGALGGAGYGAYKALSGEKKAEDVLAEKARSDMNNDVREAVIGIVAGLRGEKRADKGKAVGSVLGWLGARLRRAGQLLAGGDKAKLAPHLARVEKLKQQVPFVMDGKQYGGSWWRDRLRNYLDGLTGRYTGNGHRSIELPRMQGDGGRMFVETAGLQLPRMAREAESSLEMLKSLGMRVGTGAAALGLGRMALGGGSKEAEKRASVGENLHEQAGGSSGMANDTREAILDVVSGMRAQKSAAAPAVQGASAQSAQPVARQAARPAAAAVQAAGGVTGAAGQEAAEAMRGHESSDMMTELVLRMVARSRGAAQRAAQRRAGIVGSAGVTGAAAAKVPVQAAARAPAAVQQTAVPAAAGAQAAAAPAVPKAAEAYFAGFRKAAEDMGVDPVELYKQAQIKQRIANGLGRVGGFFRRIFGGGQQSGQKALGAYAARARTGVAPTMDEARGTLDKVLGEYFGGKVPPGLRESILGPFGK